MALSAQVLARPGWAGSGVAPEAWWVRPVLYRLDPGRFQDSDGDGHGDIAGVVQRLDYLQSLGVDALLLDGQLSDKDTDALEDLIREASRRQLRVILTASDAVPQQELTKSVLGWLGAGAAGIWLPRRSGLPESSDKDGAYAARVNAVRTLMQSFPGDRVLLTTPAPIVLKSEARPVHGARRINPDSFHAGKGGLLVTRTLLPVNAERLNQSRAALVAMGEDAGASTGSVLNFAPPPATDSPDAFANAAVLLGSRGAVMLDFGQELGLDTYPNTAVDGGNGPLMQWTPANRTAPLPASASQEAASTPSEPQFGTYHPYVPPPRGLVPSASSIRVVPDRNIPDALPAVDTLAGFTTGTLTSKPQESARLNVATEDRDSKSLLNAYRQLIAIHHGNATVRNGTQSVLYPVDEHLLIWVRRAPSGSRTVANVIGAVNLSGHAATVDFNRELESQGMRPGAIRTLFSSPQEATAGATTSSLTLPPHGALLGEIYHSGSYAEPAPRIRRGSRRSGRRVRR